MAQAARLAARLQRELRMLHSDPPPGVCAWLCDDHLLTHLQAKILGPQGTVYSNGIFKLDIQVPERYPFEPPNIRFVTPVYHPNIDNGGRICLDLLNLPPKGGWRPSLNLSTLLASIGLLLAEPNPDDGLMSDITAEYKHDRPSFDLKARRWTELYAIEGQVVSELGVAEGKISSSMEPNQNGAHGQGAMAVAYGSDGSQVQKSGTSSEWLKSGSFSSKRLALDKGSTVSVSQSKHSYATQTGTTNQPPKDISNCSDLATKSFENYSLKDIVLSEKAQPETVKAAKPDKKPHLEAYIGSEPSGFSSRELLSHDHDSLNLALRKKAQGSEDPSVEKENQAPNQWYVLKDLNVTSSALATGGDKGMARDKVVQVPSDVNNSTPSSHSVHEIGRGKSHLCLSYSRAKSLKLSRGKSDSQTFHTLDVQLTEQMAMAETKRTYPIVIPDNVPTVVISDSGSDDESSDEGFSLPLTQRSLLNKRKKMK